MNMPRLGVKALAVAAMIFGVLTLVSGGQALFGRPANGADLGNVVPFVLWFNFIAGAVYVVAGAGLLLRRRWAVTVAGLLAVSTLLVFAGFGIHVAMGGAYEMRTVVAMTIRTLFWGLTAVLAMRDQQSNYPQAPRSQA